MRVQLKDAPNRWPLPWYAMAIIAVQALIILGLYHYTRKIGVDGTICALKRFTGVPCAGCRGTRAGLSLLKGDIADAFQFNPMVTTGLLSFCAYCLVRIVFKKQLSLGMSGREISLAAALLVALFIGNWAYVIQMGG